MAYGGTRLALLLLHWDQTYAWQKSGNLCVPPEKTLWLIATFHETGTVLNHGIFRDVTKASGTHVAHLNEHGEIVTNRHEKRHGHGPHSHLLEKAPAEWRRKICTGRVL